MLNTDRGPAASDHALTFPEQGRPYRVVDDDAGREAETRGLLDLTPVDRQGMNRLLTDSAVRDRLGLHLSPAALDDMDGRLEHMLDKDRLLTAGEFEGRAWADRRARTAQRAVAAAWR